MKLNKERTLAEIFTDTVGFLQKQWRTFFLYLSIYVAPVSIIAHYFSSKIDLANLSSNDLLLFLLFSLIANFLLQSISYAYIICAVKSDETPTRQAVQDFFSNNILSFVKAFFISNLGIGIAFSLFIVSGNFLLAIPGILVLAPLSLYMLDRIYSNSSSLESLSRSTKLVQSNFGMSVATVSLSYSAIFLLQFAIALFLPKFSVGAQIIVNVSLTLFSSVVYIVIALLYFSLLNKIQKPYDNY